MPKFLNNKGIAFIPILVLVLVLTVFGFVGYSFFKSGNLNVLQSTSSNDILFVLNSSSTSGGGESLTFSIRSNNLATKDFINKLKTQGVTIGEICYSYRTDECPKDKVVKPRILEKGLNAGEFYRFQLPVTWKNNIVSFTSIEKTSNSPVDLNFSYSNENLKKRWTFYNNTSGDGRGPQYFGYLGKNEQNFGPISVSAKVLSKSKNSETIEFKYEGNNPTLARIYGLALRKPGGPDKETDYRFNGFDSTNKDVTQVLTVQSNRINNGAIIFNVIVPSNINRIELASFSLKSGGGNGEFKLLPSGWTMNKDSYLVRSGSNVSKPTSVVGSVTISVTSVGISGSTDRNFNFIARGSQSQIDDFKINLSKGVEVSNCERTQNCSKLELKPNVVCGNPTTVGCRFTVRVPSSAKYINFNAIIDMREGASIGRFTQIPKGWCLGDGSPAGDVALKNFDCK